MIKKRKTFAWSVKIWMAGNVADAERVCRQYCWEAGLCVTVTPTNYIYTGGSQSGFVVGLINYARFPVEESSELLQKAEELAKRLMTDLYQMSCSIETPTDSYYYERTSEIR